MSKYKEIQTISQFKGKLDICRQREIKKEKQTSTPHVPFPLYGEGQGVR